MRLKTFINEARRNEVTYQFAQHYLEKYCSKALKGQPIYRGVDDYTENYYTITPSDFDERTSPYADHNYYNLLLSNLPSWSSYPKRNKSIICTTDINNAERRAHRKHPYYVIPTNSAKIAVCPANDIWYSFQSFSYNMNNFNSDLHEFLQQGRVEIDDEFWDVNYKEFKIACSDIDKIRDNGDLIYNDDYDIDYLRIYNKGKTKLIDFLSNLLDPKEHEFRLMAPDKYFGDDVEVWIGSECLLIDVESEIGITLFK